jgi:hypothetical protein
VHGRPDAAADGVVAGPGVHQTVTAHRRVRGDPPVEQIPIERLRPLVLTSKNAIRRPMPSIRFVEPG